MRRLRIITLLPAQPRHLAQDAGTLPVVDERTLSLDGGLIERSLQSEARKPALDCHCIGRVLSQHGIEGLNGVLKTLLVKIQPTPIDLERVVVFEIGDRESLVE